MNRLLNKLNTCYDPKIKFPTTFDEDEVISNTDNEIIDELYEKYDDKDRKLWTQLNKMRINVIIKRLHELGHTSYITTFKWNDFIKIDDTKPETIEIWNLERELLHRRTWVLDYHIKKLEEENETEANNILHDVQEDYENHYLDAQEKSDIIECYTDMFNMN